jgi:PTH2 family peptidyl-tRNA hydrolase
MSRGKIASQACHACLEASEIVRKKHIKIWMIWRKEGAKKAIVKVDSLQELLEIMGKAKNLGLPCSLIVDRGLTEIPPETPTALGIGPSLNSAIDKVTGSLKLLR